MTDKRDVERRENVVEYSVLDQDKIHDVTTQDIEPDLEYAKSLRDSTSEHRKYGKTTFGCVHAGHIPEVMVLKMLRGQCCSDGKTYDVLSSDQEEVRRAYLHIQCCHKEYLTVRGKPFAKKRVTWQ